jgi:hypothetical protein
MHLEEVLTVRTGLLLCLQQDSWHSVRCAVSFSMRNNLQREAGQRRQVQNHTCYSLVRDRGNTASSPQNPNVATSKALPHPEINTPGIVHLTFAIEDRTCASNVSRRKTCHHLRPSPIVEIAADQWLSPPWNRSLSLSLSLFLVGIELCVSTGGGLSFTWQRPAINRSGVFLSPPRRIQHDYILSN